MMTNISQKEKIMEKYSLDRDWKFHKGDIQLPETKSHTDCYMAAKAGGASGAASPDFDKSGWESVNLPHDWAVYNEFEEKWGPSQGYKERGKAWYSKRFRLDESDRGKQILIEFEGISSYATVYLNGSVIGRNFCGYNSFVADATDMALYGDQINDLVVFADATVVEGWWYEGAGIYRHVNLYKKNKLHIAHWGVFVHPEKKSADVWDAVTDTTIENSYYTDKDFMLKTYILDAHDNVVGKSEIEFSVKGGSTAELSQSILTYSPLLWDIDSPNLYRMVSELYDGETLTDKQVNTFGFRTISIDADNGFFLNGRRVPLYGTCNHQDHAGVGVAVPDSVNEYRIKLLKEMGSNAYRCAHGNPNPEILDFCDKYGMLVMDENRNFNTSADGIKQVHDMVMRDRNHPCVVMYSLFNEEPLQGTPTGRNLAERLQCEIKKLDSTRFLLGAMNTGVTTDGGACDILDMTGFNYITHTYDDFREKYPNMPMIGSENDSAFQTRGVYKTDHNKNIIDCYDSEAAAWGNTYRDGFKQIDSRPHIMGLFIWTGFDYRGEPTPFEWPSIGTQFGIMDTCGFKKDAFYLNKAFFTDEPMIHVLPHWNHNDGEEVRVMVHTNCTEAELFLNGKTLGKKNVDKYDMADWIVPFEKGTLKMIGYIDGKEVCSDSVVTSGAPKKIVIEPHRDFVYDGCDDVAIFNISVQDENGFTVPTADNLIKFSAVGGEIIGVGNGNPNSHEADKAEERHLFNGLCQVIVNQTDGEKTLTLSASSDGLESASVTLDVKERDTKPLFIPSVNEKYITKWRQTVEFSAERPNPNIKIEDSDMNTWAIVSVGSGPDNNFRGVIGYSLFKTTVSIHDTDNRIIFRELLGNEVELFVGNELKFSGDCQWGRKVEIDVSGLCGDVELSVIIHTTRISDKGGISRPVVVTD
jgi:beta-galactosidase